MFKPIGALFAVLVLVGAAFAQAPAAAVKRTPDGKPDLSGTWQTGGISLTGGPQGNVVPAGAAPPAAGGGGCCCGGGCCPGGKNTTGGDDDDDGGGDGGGGFAHPYSQRMAVSRGFWSDESLPEAFATQGRAS